MNEALANALDVMDAKVDESISAVMERGGSITANAGLVHLPDAIRSIPSGDTSLYFHTDNTSAYKKTVPSGAQSKTSIVSVGGKTRVITGANLFPYAAANGKRVSLEVDAQEQSVGSVLLPKGSYRFSAWLTADIEDDVVEPQFGAAVNVYSDPTQGWVGNGSFFTISEPTYIVPWVGAYTYNGTPEITVTKTMGGATTSLDLSYKQSITIPVGGSCDIRIKTNTRVKVTVPGGFENRADEEFILTKGEYLYWWQNANNEPLTVNITVEQYIPGYIDATFYPMVYSVPNEDELHIIPEYVPYGEHLAPTPVTEISSEHNTYVTNQCLEATETGYVYDGGHLSLVTWDNEHGDGYYKFNLINKPEGSKATVLLYQYDDFLGAYGEGEKFYFNPNASYWASTQIEGVALGEVIYPMFYKATDDVVAQNYCAYQKTTTLSSRLIDTVAIPDAVKSDARWGHGVVDWNKKAYANTYDFNSKTYTKNVSDVIVLDGVTNKCTGKQGKRFYFNPVGTIDTANTALKVTRLNPVRWGTNDFDCWIEGALVVIMPFESQKEANEWLKTNPIELVYALANPIVTTITDDSYKPPKMITTEAGGSIVFKNTAEEAVPSEVKYLINMGEV